VRHAELLSPDIDSLARVFRGAFHAPVDVQAYATPAGSFGFSWHYDAEDVFIFQCAGEKEYWLRKNTVNPWPLEETLPADMRYEREIMPLMRVMLRAGDLLYIPCGYWHRAQATDFGETSISLAVGVMSLSAMDVFALLRSELLQSIIWRQRLPVSDDPQSNHSVRTRDTLRNILEQLASDVSSSLRSATFLERVMDEFKL
jgi:50S ribosomal protein L16 3-hydroxylase